MKQEGPAALPFGSLPILEHEGLRLAQGPVIMAYLGRRLGAAPEDPQDAACAESIVHGSQPAISKISSLVMDSQPSKDSLKNPLDLKCVGLSKMISVPGSCAVACHGHHEYIFRHDRV